LWGSLMVHLQSNSILLLAFLGLHALSGPSETRSDLSKKFAHPSPTYG
jgi:hypothetical protein